MRAVFLDRQTFSEQLSLSAIKSQVNELITYPLTANQQVIERCQDADIVITNKVVLCHDILAKLSKVKLICIAATGTNNVDLVAAKAFGIAVTNVADYAKNSVTQYVFSQILAYFSKTQHHIDNVKSGLWQRHHSFCLHGNGSEEIAGKTITIVGYGALGASVANVAKAFGMEVLIAERPNASEIRGGRVSFEHALAQADIVSLHCPQTPETEGLINTKTLALMKPTAMLINTARGAIVNPKDLHQALEQKQIAYAVLDVLTQEPPQADDVLLANPLDNLVITAHIAWASHQAQQKLLDLIADNIASFKQNGQLNRVN
ncbi:D-2-hydroxyacid dehydrogenase [Thalassotalea ganghwensis]